MADEPVESESTTPKTSAAVAAQRDAIKPFTAVVFGASLTALAIGGLVFIVSIVPVNSLGFNALVGTAILSIGLIALIVLSRAVGISEPAAALGLPPGSIRALLALGLAIVFVSVASWSLGGLFDTRGYVVDERVIAESDYENYKAKFPSAEHEFATRSVTKEEVAKIQIKPDNNATYLKATTYKKKSVNPDMLDLAKQILTITATVLVTVVGFYFGSNSSSEAVRNLRETLSELHGGRSLSSADVADLQKTMQQIDTAGAGIKSRLTELGDDPIAPLAAAVKAADVNKELEDRLIAAQKAFTDCKSAAAQHAASTAKAKDIFNAIRANAAAPELMQTNVQLRQCLTDAEKASQQFDKSVAEFIAARDYVLQNAAKG